MKSSGGNWFAGDVWSPSRSRTVWLNWLCVRRRRSDLRSGVASAGSLLFAIFQRPGQLDAGKLRQPFDPRLEDRFILAARLDSLAAGMRNAVRGLVQQQRSCPGCSRSISVTSDRPNASIFSGGASGSGKCRRVGDATPSGL